ncbi:hypothetical protein Tco_0564714 [Tanacetum coccineum]
MTLSPSSFRKSYRSFYKTPSSSSLASSLTLPVWKRYRGTSELIKDTKGESLKPDSKRERSEDEGPNLEEEEVAPEGQSQQAVQVVDTVLGYKAARHRALELAAEITPSTFEIGQSSRSVPDQQTPPSPEWLSGSLPVSPLSPVIPTLVASPVDSSPVASPATTLAAIIAVDKDEFLDVGAQLELHGSMLHDHAQRLDALPPTLFEGYDRDLRVLYTMLRTVRDEIFSQRYKLRSLE